MPICLSLTAAQVVTSSAEREVLSRQTGVVAPEGTMAGRYT